MQRILVALLTFSIATGCTTTRSVSPIEASVFKYAEPGKTVVIEFLDGSREKVTVRSYSPSSVEVVSADDSVRRIEYADIRRVHAKWRDKNKTAGALIGGVLVLGLLALTSSGVGGFPSTAPAL